MERKRVYYYSFEDLYDVAESSQGIQGEAGLLAVILMEYYGFVPMLAFTIFNNTPQDTSPITKDARSIIQDGSYIVFREGNEENIIFQILEQYYEEYNNYYIAVEKTVEEIWTDFGEIGGLEDFEENVPDVIGIIVFDGHNIGIAIGHIGWGNWGIIQE